MRILVTRPLPDGERTAAALRARGHDVLLVPLMPALLSLKFAVSVANCPSCENIINAPVIT